MGCLLAVPTLLPIPPAVVTELLSNPGSQPKSGNPGQITDQSTYFHDVSSYRYNDITKNALAKRYKSFGKCVFLLYRKEMVPRSPGSRWGKP